MLGLALAATEFLSLQGHRSPTRGQFAAKQQN
jgi:hypothetical protein